MGVFVWVDRAGAQREQNIGPFRRYLRGPDGKPVTLPGSTRPVEDPAAAALVMKLLGPYDGGSASLVREELQARKIRDPWLAAVRTHVLAALDECSERVSRRQQRAGSNRMRAPELAEFEFHAMTVHVRDDA